MWFRMIGIIGTVQLLERLSCDQEDAGSRLAAQVLQQHNPPHIHTANVWVKLPYQKAIQEYNIFFSILQLWMFMHMSFGRAATIN